MASTIEDLPIEIIFKIFRKLNLEDVVSSITAYPEWFGLGIHFFIKPALQILAKDNEKLKASMQNEKCNDDFIFSLWNKYQTSKGKISSSQAPVRIKIIYALKNIFYDFFSKIGKK